MTEMDRDMGRLEARMEAVETEVQAMRVDVREIRDALVKARGGWFMLTVALSLAATFGSLVSKHLPAVIRVLS
jgi:hypothetical protein